MLNNQEKVFTIKEIAHKLRVCVNTVRSMIRKGTPPRHEGRAPVANLRNRPHHLPKPKAKQQQRKGILQKCASREINGWI